MTPMSTFTVRADTGGCKAPPFAQLPHDIAADPRLTPVDIRVIAALLFWARDKASAWPSDASIGKRVGRAVATVQRSLRRLQALGLVQREKVEPSDSNRTGRVIRLAWRVDHPCDTPRSPTINTPRSPVIDEGRNEGERERPGSGPSREGSPPPAGDGVEAPSTSAEELALWTSWAEGSNPTLARIGRAALATDGAVQVEAPPTPGRPFDVPSRHVEAAAIVGEEEAPPAPDAVTTPPPSGVGVEGIGPGGAMVGGLSVEDGGRVLADRPVPPMGPDADALGRVARRMNRPALDPPGGRRVAGEPARAGQARTSR
jgi:hypothetical protein